MQPQSRRVNRLLFAVCVLAAILLAVKVGLAARTLKQTGTLHITTSEPNADVIISQPNHTAALLGKGDVSARLKPGDYLVSAELSGQQTTAIVHITGGKATAKRLNPANTQYLASTNDTNFINFDILKTNGLEDDQVNRIEDLFREFAGKPKNIVINQSTVQTAPHDPNSDTPFALTFSVSIDSVVYGATVTYANDGTSDLVLTDGSGAQIYASEPLSSPDS